ncbi:MAG TPA: peroxidase family protein [Gemmataceae bacterium]|nr:peroxidase family protein [Gemmataceae bacterium]
MPKKHAARLRTGALEDRLVPSGGLDVTDVEWRSIDGTNNNAERPTQGAAETRQIRFGYGAQFPDGFGDTIITAPQRANPRTVSNAVHAQSGSVTNDRHLTDWAFQWGQWITHDLDLTRNGAQYDDLYAGGTGDFSIPIEDPDDPLGPNPIPFHRSEYDPATGTPDPVPGTPPRLNRREVMNAVTSYIDASMVYGSDADRAAALRTFQGGRLKMSAGGRLLPPNTAGLPNADPFGLGAELFLAGDVRANEQANLTAVHTVFAREHNRLANRIHDRYPSLTDEQIYQVARRLVGAEMQRITYEEYLPAVLGFDQAPDPGAATYSATVDASITNSFAHAVFRFGHSQINESTLLVNNSNQTVGSLSIRDAFFNPEILRDDPGKLGRMLKGLASQVAQETDLLMVDGVRNNLFGPPGAGGLDLAALDIQRGRDHGLPDYNTLRKTYGLARVTSFAEITSDPQVQAELQQLYGTVDNIDAFVGALAEDHLPGSGVGPLIRAVVGNQFERLRDGDRFFYATDPFLASDAVRQVLKLEKVTLAKVIRWNTDVTGIQDNVFFDKSVVVFQAPDAGANVTLTAAGGNLTLTDTRTGQVLNQKSLGYVSLVILVGSNDARDFFNIHVAGAAGGLEEGVQVYGGASGGDVMNVYGRATDDQFAVGAAAVDVNGNGIHYSGIETTRVVTRGGDDDVSIEPGVVADVISGWDPLDEQ